MTIAGVPSRSPRGPALAREGREAMQGREAVSRILCAWDDLRAEIAATREGEHPKLRDGKGCVWEWKTGDVYRDGQGRAWPRDFLPEPVRVIS